MEKEIFETKGMQLSKEDIELQRRKNKNIKLYPIYRMLSWDLLFYYAIIYLFLTIEKKITPAQALQFDAFYLLFKALLQIPCTLVIQRIGKRKSLIMANAIATIHVLFIIFAPNFSILILSQFLCAFAFNIKGTCDTDMLYDSLEHSEKRGSDFAKIDGRASSRYFYIDAISSLLAGFLYVINPYIPITLCLVTLFATFLLTIKFESLHLNREKKQIKDEVKNIRLGLKNIFKSKRLLSLLIFNSLFVGLLKILQNIRNTQLIEIGMPEQCFGIIFATMALITGISARAQGKIHKRFRNKTLTILAIPTAISIIIAGLLLISELEFYTKANLLIVMFAIQYMARGPYYVLIKRYFNNFTNSEKRVKISTANILCENTIAALLIFGGSYILEFADIKYTTLIIGCIATMAFVVFLDYMRNTVGLKPEQYSKKEIL